MCEMFSEYCAVWRETHRKARKDHKCDCCGALIRAGERYMVVASVFEGQASSEKQCLSCTLAIVEFADRPGHMKWMPSGFRHVLEDCVDGDPKSDWLPMLEAMKRRAA